MWPIKAVMCVGFVMMILQAISELFKDIAIIRGVEIK
jgi:TRAP-type mannitol/chloroaromatic compound transport system permease small subunit